METLNIPAAEDLRPTFATATRRELESLVGRSGPRFRWSRRSAVVGLGIGIAVAGGGVAAAHLAFQPITDHASAHCFSLDALGTNGTTVVAAGAPGSHALVTNALATCSMLWRDGFLEVGVPHVINVSSNTTVHTVPLLVVCTLSDGTAGVFPGDSRTCATLGLERPEVTPGG